MRRKCTGAKLDTEAMDARKRVVEEQCMLGRSMTERTCGLHTRENAGISSESGVRISAVESLRIPEEGSSSQGKPGPKPRRRRVGDG